MHSYDLIESPWLMPQLCGHGALTRCSLRDALVHAHKFGALEVEVTTHTPALLRQVLLPVILDALGRPKDRAEWALRVANGRFTDAEQDKLNAYLDEHRHRFDLFDQEAPFAQVAELHTANHEAKGSALLVATQASGNNVPLYSTRTDGDPLLLTPAEAVRWLLHTHCWDTAGIKSGAVGDPAVKAGKTTGNVTGVLGPLGVVVPVGRSLFETLMLNIPIGRQPADDLPQWRRPPAQARWETRHATGLLDLWTWQARRVRLIPEQTDEGLRVRQVVLCAGDRLQSIPEWEPHTAWTFARAPKSPTGSQRRPRRHVPGKAAWRGMEALLTAERQSGDGGVETSVLLSQLADVQADGVLPFDYPLQVQTIGMVYGNQSAVVEDVLFDSIPLPITGLRTETDTYTTLVEVTEQAEDLARAVNDLSADLRRARGADPIPWNKGQRPGEFVLHALDPLMRRFLVGVRASADGCDTLERGRIAWEQLASQQVLSVATRLLNMARGSEFAGRVTKAEKAEYVYRLASAEQNFDERLHLALPRWAQSRRGNVTLASSPLARAAGQLKGERQTAMTSTTDRIVRYWTRYVAADGTWRSHQGPPPGEDLAVFRAGLGRPAGTVPALWPYYTSPIDDWLARQGKVSHELTAEHAALALYGLHQQSRSDPMHRPGVPLGQALRRLHKQSESDRGFMREAVDRRVNAAASATQVGAFLTHLRGLISQMRIVGAPLDYDLLLRDIRYWQRPDTRQLTRRRLGLDYYGWQPKPHTPAEPIIDFPSIAE
ncbi:type I-E CRISPR-associated protein Cse1/CasA [Nonomuraea sp. NPDC002799]